MSKLIDVDRLLLPDEQRWGQGVGRGRYSVAELDEIADNVAGTVQPGYSHRLYAHAQGYVPGSTGGPRATVPPSYDAVGHPNRAGADRGSVDPDVSTALEDPQQIDPRIRQWCQARGWVLDQHGRPLHPHHEQLLADGRIGMPTGLGYGWWLGETVVADAVVTARGHLLVVDRDTDAGVIPSIPGGYTIPEDFGRTTAQWRSGDRPITADGIITGALRRTAAETGLVVPRWAEPTLVRGVRPVSSVHTVHAWTMTLTVNVDIPGDELPALDQATSARWVSGPELYSHVLDRMWPDHRRAVLAIE